MRRVDAGVYHSRNTPGSLMSDESRVSILRSQRKTATDHSRQSSHDAGGACATGSGAARLVEQEEADLTLGRYRLIPLTVNEVVQARDL